MYFNPTNTYEHIEKKFRTLFLKYFFFKLTFLCIQYLVSLLNFLRLHN